MKAFFLKNKKIIYALIIPYFLFLFMLTYKIEYSVTTPGNITNVDGTLKVNDGKEINGSISSTYVGDLTRITFFQFICGYFNKYAELSVIPEEYQNLTNDEIYEIGVIDHNSSIDFSIISAYKALGFVDLIGEEKIFVSMKYTDVISDKSFPVGAELLSVDGVSGYEAISTYLAGKKENDEVLFKVKHKNEIKEYMLKKVKDESGKLWFGIGLYVYKEVDKSAINIDVYETSVTGPSGGLLQSLYIYASLCDEDIIKGHKIAGTGTIDSEGNVGAIGGVKQKIATAYLSDVDVFFIPADDGYYDNYSEAIEFAKKTGILDKVNIVPVATLEEAIEYLRTFGVQ